MRVKQLARGTAALAAASAVMAVIIGSALWAARPVVVETRAQAALPSASPERAKHYFVARANGRTYPRDLVTTEAKLTAVMTDGRYSFLDEVWHPGFTVPSHFHVEHAEIFYVLGGRVEWTVNGETRVMGAGDLVFIPPDTPHAVRVVGNENVHTLMVYEPGGYEDHMDEEATYTAEQRKQPEIVQRMRGNYDFNPTPMPKSSAAPRGSVPAAAKGAVRPIIAAPLANRHVFSLRGQGETFTPENEVSEVKLSAIDTDGRYSFLDEIWKPGMAVPPHFHARHTETFYVVSGQVEWTVGGETQIVGAGGLVYIPPDTVHSVKVVGSENVQSLMLYSPGGYEYHSRREAQYTPEQRKQPDVQERLRRLNDFNPVR